MVWIHCFTKKMVGKEFKIITCRRGTQWQFRDDFIWSEKLHRKEFSGSSKEILLIRTKIYPLASRIERLYVEACLLYEDLHCWTISRGEFRCFKVLSLLRRTVSKLSLYFNLGDQKKKQPRIAPELFRLMNAYLRLSVLEIENLLVTRNSIRSPRPPLGLSQGGEIAFLKGL